MQSGIFIPGNGKSLVKLKGADDRYLLAASQNRGTMKIFALKDSMQQVSLNSLDVKAAVKYKNGKTQLRELGYGSSFLSQSGRFLSIGNEVISVSITDSKGETRTIK